MNSDIDCGKLNEVLESIYNIPVDAAKLEKWVNGGEFETVMLGGKEVPCLRNLVRQIDERESQAAEEEINEAKVEIGALAAKIQAKIDDLKAMTASAETLPPDHPATVYYNAGTGEFEFGIPQGKQGIQGERGLAPAVDIIYGGDPSDEALSIIYGGNPALDEPGDRTIVRQVARIGTSAQWATANPVLEDGESGYERTPEGKLLWKTGDGVTHWNDLPYPSILVDRIYRYRGSVATVEDLPADAAEGDVYNITSTGANYAWTGETWDNLGVVQEIDAAPIKDSGNPVASGGVYAALDKLGTDVSEQGQAISNLQSDVSALEGQFPIPLYQGATDSEAGTAGLVPPAAPEERKMALLGSGVYGKVGADAFWDSEVYYESPQLVIHNGDVYAWQEPSINVEPGTDDSKWALIAKGNLVGYVTATPGTSEYNAQVAALRLREGAIFTVLDDGAGHVLPSPVAYELCEFYYFRHPTLRPGFQPAQGGLITNAATLYPDAWAYLQTAEGQKLCKTEAEWQAMSTATWYTLADGTKVGWEGIGGVPYYVQDLNAGTLRLPDLRGMYAEASGFDGLDAGGVHGDGMRSLIGELNIATNQNNDAIITPENGIFDMGPGSTLGRVLTSDLQQTRRLRFLSDDLVPVSAVNRPRAWGALACVHLGRPAS